MKSSSSQHWVRRTVGEIFQEIILSSITSRGSLRLHRFTRKKTAPRSFWNVDGVMLKYSNLQTHQPDYAKAKTRGGKTDKQVIKYVLEDPQKALNEAARVRELLENRQYLPVLMEDDFVDISTYEGRQMLSQHLRRERNPKLRRENSGKRSCTNFQSLAKLAALTSRISTVHVDLNS